MTRIKEAIEYHNRHNSKFRLNQMKLAELVHPRSNKNTRSNRLNRLAGGLTSPTIDEVIAICRITGVDPNFLFGRKAMKNKDL